ncbi:ATP-binding cassette domain-containing protein [Microcoleus vaginatus PCC 9802]|uniref:AAA family ATPase n=1 Tax=Microcoleus vaginatus TaxID=119532 RepID=UPI00020D1FCD|nr:SMC domain protein [Microcoleus vaginatus FGP-2]UNU17735.1 ATP-binding cassette domain-containing protein [Microcoleus vaginatus PCC 9802]
MIGEVRIENYKSIQKLKLELGRVTVLIGENGCGKSNILEAIALASAAADDKLDNEFLASRGIRVTEPQLMRSAFEIDNLIKDIKIELRGNEVQPFSCILQNDNSPYSQWVRKNFLGDLETFLKSAVKSVVDKYGGEEKLRSILLEEKRDFSQQELSRLTKELHSFSLIISLTNFIIYSPENQALRTFEKEGQIQPLGINGEGLFKILKFLSSDNQQQLNEIKKKLQLIDWFQDFEAPPNLSNIQSSLQIKDRYLDHDLSYFDQRSSNEGFLFLLFYFALFISDLTPKFFAIDNIDASLNPRLCRRLMQELVELAKKHDKQVIFTTHNPAVLDGLDLDDDEQRLFVIYRNQLGHTKARRILKPKTIDGQEPVKLSEAFLRGYIGGLPKNF